MILTEYRLTFGDGTTRGLRTRTDQAAIERVIIVNRNASTRDFMVVLAQRVRPDGSLVTVWRP